MIEHSKERVLKPHTVLFLLTLFLAGIVCPAASLAQDDRVLIDKSRIPAEASDAQGFVPSAWKIEEQVSGDWL
jgi:hypothetical protein